jgi:DNA-binding transcriptional MerR regulator
MAVSSSAGADRLVVPTGTLTVEPGFKSTAGVDDDLLSIGELAARAELATSAVRYYERRGLLRPDARRSGQRRYRPETLRQLVFIGMLQDAGLSLDDIDGILTAATIDEWKAIAQRRLDALDQDIERLEHARSYLQAALNCRFDHPLTECAVMGAEIDRRTGRATDEAEP